MGELSEHEILWNTAALRALRRPQLVNLSKKYGLRANGKNVDLVERLHDFGATLTPTTVIPHHEYDMDAGSESEPESSPATQRSFHPVVPPSAVRAMPSTRTLGRVSDAWEVLSTSDASLVEAEPTVEGEEPTSQASVRSWKSAGNGATLDEFGNAHEGGRVGGSLKSIASSLKRTASRTLSGRNVKVAKGDKAPIRSVVSLPQSVHEPEYSAPAHQDEEEEDEEEILLPSSPASTVGIPKRRPSSMMTLQERPSTIRLVSPTPDHSGGSIGLNSDLRPMSVDLMDSLDNDELPLTGRNSIDRIKQRRSMAPLRSPNAVSATGAVALNRRSMPALLSLPSASRSGSESVSNIYPALPSFSSMDMGENEDVAPAPAIPGSFPPLPPTPTRVLSPSTTAPTAPFSPSFIFGAGNQVSSSQFSEAGFKLLQEMQSKMGTSVGGSFNAELLKGKKAEITKLVNVNAELGTSTSSTGSGGWGLSAGANAIPDRYATAHQREFARMQSLTSLTGGTATGSGMKVKRKLEPSTSGPLPSAPNGLPLPTASTDGLQPEDGRRAKRSKMSVAPRYLDSLRGAGRSIVTKLADDHGLTGATPRRRGMSTATETGRRFPFLRKKSTAPSAKMETASIAESTVSVGSYVLPSSSAGTYGGGSHEFDSSKFNLAAFRRNVKRASTDLSTVISRQPTISAKARVGAHPAQTVLTKHSRPPIPDFSPVNDKSRGTGVSSSTLSRGTASSLAKSTASRPTIRSNLKSTMTAASASSIPRSTSGHLARVTSLNSLGLPNTPIYNSMKKQSRVDLITAARPVPPPPLSAAAGATGSNSLSTSRSSTLLAPTVSSLARMQATVKPPLSTMPLAAGSQSASASTSGLTATTQATARPLPIPPKTIGPYQAPASVTGPAPYIPTAKPFGTASSRVNHLFESNFHLPQPLQTAKATDASTVIPQSSLLSRSTTSTLAAPSSSSLRIMKSPTKSASSLSASRLRARSSGLAAVKSRGHLRDEAAHAGVQQRRAEIRARQERLVEERELRRMLE